MPSRAFRWTIAALALAATVCLAVFSQPASAVEIVATGNVEVVSTNCATLQCNTVADGGGLEVVSDGLRFKVEAMQGRRIAGVEVSLADGV